jgi:dCMP deaminase
MRVAEDTAQLSYAIRRKVGAVLVQGDNILSYGYNGTLPGESNDCEILGTSGELVTKPEVIHAEENALMKLLRENKGSSNGATMYVTTEPCIICARLMANAGITRLVYRDQYRVHDGIDLLNKRNVTVERMERE